MAGRLNRVWDQPSLNGSHDPVGVADFTYNYIPKSWGLIANIDGPVHTVINSYDTNRSVLLAKNNKPDSFASTSHHLYTVGDGVNGLGRRTSHYTFGTALPDTFGENGYRWRKYGYNSKGELATADFDQYSTSPSGWQTWHDYLYDFDAIGNRKTSTTDSSVTTYHASTAGTVANQGANAKNQYQSIRLPSDPSPVARNHDADGNTTATKLPADLTQSAALEWDAENRLVRILDTSNNVIASYDYDYLGRRFVKFTASSGEVRSYLYDGWNVLIENVLDAGGSTSSQERRHTWGQDLSGSMQGAGGVGGLLSTEIAFGVDQGTYYPTYDGNGNVSEYLDNGGNWVAHYEYDAFGKMFAGTGSKLESFHYRFSTKPEDPESGLNYYGYRYYDSVTGRWPSRDPIKENGGSNIYAFVNNRVATFIDVLGRESSGPYLPDPNRKPPGWNDDWGEGEDKRGPYSHPPGEPDQRYYPHPEDPGHWDHYDCPDGKRYPPNGKKNWPNQKKPKPDQSPVDPWPEPKTVPPTGDTPPTTTPPTTTPPVPPEPTPPTPPTTTTPPPTTPPPTTPPTPPDDDGVPWGLIGVAVVVTLSPFDGPFGDFAAWGGCVAAW